MVVGMNDQREIVMHGVLRTTSGPERIRTGALGASRNPRMGHTLR